MNARRESGGESEHAEEAAEPSTKPRWCERSLSLFPLKPDEASRRAMSVPPARKTKRVVRGERWESVRLGFPIGRAHGYNPSTG